MGNNASNGAGRPTDYPIEAIEKLAALLEEWIKEKDNLFIQKFAFEMDFNHRKVSEFKGKCPRFREACEKLDAKQQFSLFEGSLKRKYAHPMCALILSHNHNINQKTEQKISGDSLNPLHFIISNIDGETKDLLNESK